MTNSGAKELLYFVAPKGKRVSLSDQVIDQLKVRGCKDLEQSHHSFDVQWASWTSVLGTKVSGIWPHGSDITDVNATCLSSDGQVRATSSRTLSCRTSLLTLRLGHCYC